MTDNDRYAQLARAHADTSISAAAECWSCAGRASASWRSQIQSSVYEWDRGIVRSDRRFVSRNPPLIPGESA